MKKKDYFTPKDKLLLHPILDVAKKIWLDGIAFLRGLFSFSRSEIYFSFILVAGLALRIWGLLNNQYLMEEVLITKQGLDHLAFSDHFKANGDSFAGLVMTLPTSITMVLGSAQKLWLYSYGMWQLQSTYLQALPYYIFSERLFVLFLFAASLYLVFVIGRRFLTERVGLLASLLLAISPLSIQVSRFTLSHNLALLLIVLMIYLMMHWLEKRQLKFLVLLSILWGVFCATIFHGIYLTPFLLLGLLVYGRLSMLRFLLLALASYLLATSYHQFDMAGRLNSVAQEILLRRDYSQEFSFWSKLGFWGNSLTWGIFITFLGGIPFLLLSKRDRIFHLTLISFVILFFLLFSSFLFKRPEDMMLVLLPVFFCVSIILDKLFVHQRHYFYISLVAIMIFPAIALYSVTEKSPLFSNRLRPLADLWGYFNPPPSLSSRLNKTKMQYNAIVVQSKSLQKGNS